MSRLLFSAAALLFAIPAAALPGGPASDKQAIQDLYGRLTAAMRARDVKAVSRLGAPGFTTTDLNGTVRTAKQAKQAMEQHFRSLKRINDLKMTARSVSINGRKAQVVTGYRLLAVVIAEGRPLKFESSGTTRDTLLKTAEGWKFKAVRTVSARTLIDGKEVGVPASRPRAPTGRGGPAPARH